MPISVTTLTWLVQLMSSSSISHSQRGKNLGQGALAHKSFWAEFLVRWLGCLQGVSSASPLVNELFSEEFLVGYKHKLLSRKVHAHLSHNLGLACSKILMNTKKFIPISYLSHSKLMSSSSISCSQTTKNLGQGALAHKSFKVDFLVRWQGCLQVVSSVSSLVNELFQGIYSWAQT